MKKLLLTLLFLLFLNNITISALALHTGSELQPPDVGSETAVLMDADTGQVLYQKDMDRQMYPASITKIMTGMLALKSGALTDIVTMSEEAVASVDRDSANIALSPGEVFPLEDALYALAIASANDAANGIAELIGGTIDDFAVMMNTAAHEAGAVNTHFANANGLPDAEHYTTAHDMALITAEAIKTPGFNDFFGTRRYKIPPTNKQPETRIINSSNRFLNGGIVYDGLLMSKAGWTRDAQHTLATAAERDGTTLIAVVMKAADSTVKWKDTTALLDYGFGQFEPTTITRNEILQAAPDDIGITGTQELRLDTATYDTEDIALLLPKNVLPEDVQITYGEPQVDESAGTVEIPVRLSMPSGSSPNVPEILLEVTVTAALLPEGAPENDADGAAPAESAPGVFKIVMITAGAIIGVLLLLFIILLIRRAVIVRRRRLRRIRTGTGRRWRN